MSAPGLELPVTITRDPLGIPRINARSQHDAYFALGWVHAQDRFWQMEMQRRVVAGRLSELIGEKGLASDRFMRTLGLYRLAESSATKQDRPVQAALEAYGGGVNAWADQNRYRLPLEFQILGDRPAPWTPADSLAWGRLMGIELAADWREALLRAKLAPRFDAKHLAELFPGSSDESPATLSSDAAGRLLGALPDALVPRLASNVWVVAGDRTASGKPLLANDPHLALQSPAQWYLARIEAPGLAVSGATVPGIPFHLLGHTPRIAWGSTATGADTVDLVADHLTPEGTATVTPNGSQPLTLRNELIHVKNGADVSLTIRATRHGPVVSDLVGGAGPGEVISLRSTALEPDDLSPQAYYRLARATDWRGVQAALKDLGAPVQNFAYADTNGSIGFLTAGRVPLRRSGAGGRIQHGWTGQDEWTGWIAPAKLPQRLNPEGGVIVNANNRLAPPGATPPIAETWPDGWRAQRIQDLLGGRTGLTAADMAKIQADSLSLPAVELKELLSGVPPADPLSAKAWHCWPPGTDKARRPSPNP